MSSLTARLAPTPFWDLMRDGNNWLIAKGRTYLIGEQLTREDEQENLPQFCLSGKMYALEESESLDFLEERYLCQHLHVIEYIAKTQGKVKREGEAYWQHLTMLASDELTRRYSAEQRSEAQEAPEFQDSTIESLTAGYTPVSQKILKRPYALLEEMCIEFKRTSKENATANNTWLRCKGGWHTPTNHNPSREHLEKRLKSSIARQVKQRLEDILKSQRPTNYAGNGTDEPGQLIRVNSTSESGAHFKRALEPFIIRKRGKYYAFPAVELGLRLDKTKQGITIPTTAKVLSRYLHPFVYFNGRICHGPRQRFQRLGLQFSRVYKPTEYDKLAYAITTLFDEAAKVLHLGYWKGVNPVHRLMTEQFQHLECSEGKAEASGWKIYRQ